jgi:hypothetical protein
MKEGRHSREDGNDEKQFHANALNLRRLIAQSITVIVKPNEIMNENLDAPVFKPSVDLVKKARRNEVIFWCFVALFVVGGFNSCVGKSPVPAQNTATESTPKLPQLNCKIPLQP